MEDIVHQIEELEELECPVYVCEDLLADAES